MAALANSPVLEDVLVHVFSELPGNVKQNCEICRKGPAAYHWTEQHGKISAGRDSIICRVCASMVVLIGKPA
jgi:hypothetical protein